MSCDNVITVQDLETDKKHSTFYREVITGKAGGTGADIDSATNAVTGQTQATLPKVLSNVGFSPAGFDFTTGGTLTERDKAIFYQADGNWYSWGGALPKVVPPASSPASTGGIADNAWNVSTSAFMYRDWEGFTAALLAEAGIVPSGNPDTVSESQRLEAMRRLFINTSYTGKQVLATPERGVSSANTAAQNGAAVTALFETYNSVVLVEDIQIEDVIIDKPFRTLKGISHVELTVTTPGATCVTLAAGAVNCFVCQLTIATFTNDSVAISLDGEMGVGSAPQYNTFIDVFTDGNKTATECWGGTVSLKLNKTWSNTFLSCKFNRTFDGVHFGSALSLSNSVNANNFYGCEIRSINNYTNGGSPIRHYVGDGNNFIGGIIENWKERMQMLGGVLSLNGVYVEAFADACTAGLQGGHLIVKNCFRPGYVFVYSDDAQLTYVDNDNQNMSGINFNYPLVQIHGDVNPVINIDNSGVASTVFRYGEYKSGSGWVKSAIKNLRQRVRFNESAFGLHCVNDQLLVTGDGTVYTVKYSPSSGVNSPAIYYDHSSETLPNKGIFTASQGGIYSFGGSLFLTGLSSGNLISIKLIAGNITYNLYSKKVTADELSSGQIVINFSKQAKMYATETAYIQLAVFGGSKVVGILRGDASNGFTTFDGHRVN